MSNFCKYYKQKKQYSIDSGPWSDVLPYEYRMGDIIEESSDCQDSSITRTIEIADSFACEEGDKYAMNLMQYSYDNGKTWNDYYPLAYTLGRLLESDSEACNNKWEGHYWYTGETLCPHGYSYKNGEGCVQIPVRVDPTKYIHCNSTTSTTLTNLEIRYSPYVLYEGIIGSCVTSIGNATFQGETSLTSITISNGVINISDNAFSGCTSLTSITIPNSVELIGWGAFDGCTSLTSITIPNSVTSIGNGAFASCISLTSVAIGNSVTSIGGEAFSGCTSLINVTIPDNVTSIGYGAFMSDGIKIVKFEGVTPPTLTDSYSGHAPGGATFSKVTKIYVPCSAYDTYISAWSPTTTTQTDPIIDRVFPYGEYEKMEEVVGEFVCENGNKYKKMAHYVSSDNINWCFDNYVIGDLIESGSSDCGSGSTLNKIKATYTDGTTYEVNCDTDNTLTTAITHAHTTTHENMLTVEIGECITHIDNSSFSYCTSLTSVTIPNSVRTIGSGAFGHCERLTNVTIPSDVTNIGEYAFGYCYALQSITCLATTPPSLGSTGAFFQTNDCPIYVPCESVDAYKKADRWSAYSDRITCGEPTPPVTTNRIEVTFSDGSTNSMACGGSDTELTQSNVSHASSNNRNSIVSANIGTCVIGIGSSAFSGCRNLTSVTIPNSVTYIDSNAFRNCYSLTSVVIPNSVVGIGNYAFQHCRELQSITCLATTPPSIAPINYTFQYTNDCPIYVPAASVDAYKAASGWSDYGSRIQPIP